MKLQEFKHNTTEIFVEGKECSVTVNPWANMEGLNMMMHGKDLSLRLAGALRWEDIDVLLVAFNAARAIE
jgi:hypothetical protein